MKISFKLVIGFGLISLIFLIILFISSSSLQNFSKRSENAKALLDNTIENIFVNTSMADFSQLTSDMVRKVFTLGYVRDSESANEIRDSFQDDFLVFQRSGNTFGFSSEFEDTIIDINESVMILFDLKSSEIQSQTEQRELQYRVESMENELSLFKTQAQNLKSFNLDKLNSYQEKIDIVNQEFARKLVNEDLINAMTDEIRKAGIEGLIHVSKLSGGVSFVEGDKVKVYIESIDVPKRKVSLGIVSSAKNVIYK